MDIFAPMVERAMEGYIVDAKAAGKAPGVPPDRAQAPGGLPRDGTKKHTVKGATHMRTQIKSAPQSGNFERRKTTHIRVLLSITRFQAKCKGGGRLKC